MKATIMILFTLISITLYGPQNEEKIDIYQDLWFVGKVENMIWVGEQ